MTPPPPGPPGRTGRLRAVLWMLPALLLPVVITVAIAGELGVRAVVLGSLAIVPGLVVLALAADARRRNPHTDRPHPRP